VRAPRRAAIAVLGLLAAQCGGAAEAPSAPEDMALTRDQRLARLSFEQQRPEQAAALYAQALDRARERDDLSAIAALGYDLAVVQLRTGSAATALATSQATRAEVVRRGGVPRPELLLVEAAALYRVGDGRGAADLAEAIVVMPDAGTETRARASFVRGLVAADERDEPALAQAVARLPSAEGPIAADKEELEGRLALLRGDPPAAREVLLRAADRRRDALDYRGMARALALAAEAAQAEGREREAADLYLRAGRSAQLGDDKAEAGRWLGAARDLAQRNDVPDVAAEATSRLAALSAPAR